MKTIKMSAQKMVSGVRLEKGETVDITDHDARILVAMGAAKIVKDHGPDETPDAKRRKAPKKAKAKKAKAETGNPEKPAVEDDGKPGDDAGKEESLL